MFTYRRRQVNYQDKSRFDSKATNFRCLVFIVGTVEDGIQQGLKISKTYLHRQHDYQDKLSFDSEVSNRRG